LDWYYNGTETPVYYDSDTTYFSYEGIDFVNLGDTYFSENGNNFSYGDASGNLINGTYSMDEVVVYGETTIDDNSEQALGLRTDDGFDEIAASNYLVENAYDCSNGKCATNVRGALEEGGLDMSGHPKSAKDYDSFLRNDKFKFKEVSKGSYKPIIGDLMVFKPYETGNKNGHIQMFVGTISGSTVVGWASDFIQPRPLPDYYPGPGYRENKPDYTIFRWED
jgi:hypothetical protein